MLSRNDAIDILSSLRESAGEASAALNDTKQTIEDTNIKENLQPSSQRALASALEDAENAVATLQTVLRNCQRDI